MALPSLCTFSVIGHHKLQTNRHRRSPHKRRARHPKPLSPLAPVPSPGDVSCHPLIASVSLIPSNAHRRISIKVSTALLSLVQAASIRLAKSSNCANHSSGDSVEWLACDCNWTMSARGWPSASTNVTVSPNERRSNRVSNSRLAVSTGTTTDIFTHPHSLFVAGH